MDLLLLIILLVIGITGLVKRKIKVSSKKQITGGPVIGLSIFYIIMGGIIILVQGVDLVLVGIIVLVTIVVAVFAKKQLVEPKITQTPQA